jgi:hypothetical protein
MRFLGDIYFSTSENASPNSANGSFDIESDNYELHLKPSLFVEELNPVDAEGAALFMWRKLLKQAEIDYA